MGIATGASDSRFSVRRVSSPRLGFRKFECQYTELPVLPPPYLSGTKYEVGHSDRRSEWVAGVGERTPATACRSRSSGGRQEEGREEASAQ